MEGSTSVRRKVNLSAIDRLSHSDCVQKVVPTVHLYSQGKLDIAHSEGEAHKLPVKNNILNLIEK